MPTLSCEVCNPDIAQYYDNSWKIVEKNQRLISMAAGHPQGAKLLSSGRIVVLRDGVCSQEYTFSICWLTNLQHFRSNNIAVLLKPAPVKADSDGVLAKVKTYYVLALVNPDTKSGQLGEDREL